MGKGSKPRPDYTTRAEQELRWDYMNGEMTLNEFNRRYEKLKKRGLIKRN